MLKKIFCHYFPKALITGGFPPFLCLNKCQNVATKTTTSVFCNRTGSVWCADVTQLLNGKAVAEESGEGVFKSCRSELTSVIASVGNHHRLDKITKTCCFFSNFGSELNTSRADNREVWHHQEKLNPLLVVVLFLSKPKSWVGSAAYNNCGNHKGKKQNQGGGRHNKLICFLVNAKVRLPYQTPTLCLAMLSYDLFEFILNILHSHKNTC